MKRVTRKSKAPVEVDSLKLYALALSAHRMVEKAIEIAAHGVVAVSDSDARTHGMRVALQQWPVSDGWTEHMVNIDRVSDAMVNLVSKELRSK